MTYISRRNTSDSPLILFSAKLEGRSCEYNGRMYQNGENFRAGCKHQCTCVDGAVGCVPLCPTHLPLASPSCPAPRLVKVPGQCCLSLDCHKGSSVLPPVFRKPQPPPYLYPHIQPYPKPYPEPYPKQYYKRFPHKAKDTLSNELMEEGKKWDKPRSHKHLAGKKERGLNGLAWGVGVVALLLQSAACFFSSLECGLFVLEQKAQLTPL